MCLRPFWKSGTCYGHYVCVSVCLSVHPSLLPDSTIYRLCRGLSHKVANVAIRCQDVRRISYFMFHFVARRVQLLVLYEADSENKQTTCRDANSSPYTGSTSVCNATDHRRGHISATPPSFRRTTTPQACANEVAYTRIQCTMLNGHCRVSVAIYQCHL